MTAAAWTAEGDRLGLPDVIMPVGLPHERVGDLVEERVGDRLVRRRPGICLREGDDARLVVAAPRAFGGVVKLETPALELVCRDPCRRARRNGLQVVVRA